MLKLRRGGQLVFIDDENKESIVDEILPYLCCVCEIEDGVKFKDILNLIRKDCDAYSYMLTTGPWLKEIVEEGDKPYVDCEDSVKYLEVYWAAEATNYDGPDVLSEWVSIHGIGGPEGPYGLDFSPINSLTELEIKLNNEYKIFDMRNKKYLSTASLFTAQKEFTLLDILRGIFWELSFHGSVKNREERLEEIKQSVEDIKSGLVKTVPWDSKKFMEED